MNYFKEIVSTINGNQRVMTGEMRKLMKEGISRKLVPLKNFKKRPLQLDELSRQEISFLKKSIQRIKWQVAKLEYKKIQLGMGNPEVRDIDRQIELCDFDIFEAQTKIRDIKKACFKNQTQIIDLEG